MTKLAQLRIYECTDDRRRYVGTAFLDEWLNYVIGRLPTHEIEQIQSELSVSGKAKSQEGLDHWYEYEVFGN